MLTTESIFPPLHPEVSHLNDRSSNRSQINRNSFLQFLLFKSAIQGFIRKQKQSDQQAGKRSPKSQGYKVYHNDEGTDHTQNPPEDPDTNTGQK